MPRALFENLHFCETFPFLKTSPFFGCSSPGLENLIQRGDFIRQRSVKSAESGNDGERNGKRYAEHTFSLPIGPKAAKDQRPACDRPAPWARSRKKLKSKNAQKKLKSSPGPRWKIFARLRGEPKFGRKSIPILNNGKNFSRKIFSRKIFRKFALFER